MEILHGNPMKSDEKKYDIYLQMRIVHYRVWLRDCEDIPWYKYIMNRSNDNGDLSKKNIKSIKNYIILYNPTDFIPKKNIEYNIRDLSNKTWDAVNLCKPNNVDAAQLGMVYFWVYRFILFLMSGMWHVSNTSNETEKVPQSSLSESFPLTASWICADKAATCQGQGRLGKKHGSDNRLLKATLGQPGS